MDFSGTTIIVTGASRGLGKMLASILKSLNANVITTKYHNDTSFDSIKCDITNEDDVNKLFNYAKGKYNHIDAVINCATYTNDCEYTKKGLDDFMSVVKVNLGGTFLMNKYACMNMDKGVIINVSSLDATSTYSSISMDYAAAKAGVENLTKNFAKTVPNIKICAIAPAWIDTETVLQMNPNYLNEEMKNNNQEHLLKKEDVAMKIIEMIVNNDDYVSGDVIKMEA